MSMHDAHGRRRSKDRSRDEISFRVWHRWASFVFEGSTQCVAIRVLIYSIVPTSESIDRQVHSLNEVLKSRKVHGPLTKLQCCPTSVLHPHTSQPLSVCFDSNIIAVSCFPTVQTHMASSSLFFLYPHNFEFLLSHFS
jgi:hypothetical protein